MGNRLNITQQNYRLNITEGAEMITRFTVREKEIRILTEMIPGQTGVGVPAGGTTGQILAKASDANYATEWVDESGGGLSAVEDDTSPTLGGNLMLGSYELIGQLETTQLTLDGGLL